MTAWCPQPPPASAGDWDYIGTYVATSTPDGIVGEWVDGVPEPDVRAAATDFAATSRGGFREGRHIVSGCAYLRLRVRRVPSDRVEALGRLLAVDLDFGPSSAPADYPKVPLENLFDFAASNA
jgi:hypothetical protein